MLLYIVSCCKIFLCLVYFVLVYNTVLKEGDSNVGKDDGTVQGRERDGNEGTI